jgi:hypothetical protein
MVAIVSEGTADEVDAANKELARNPRPHQHPEWALRYFTLEMPSELIPEQESAFCEWDEGVRHLYRSAGPYPSADHFLEFLERFLATAF